MVLPLLERLQNTTILFRRNIFGIYPKDWELDYGWGPTAFVQNLLEHVRTYTHLHTMAGLYHTDSHARPLSAHESVHQCCRYLGTNDYFNTRHCIAQGSHESKPKIRSSLGASLKRFVISTRRLVLIYGSFLPRYWKFLWDMAPSGYSMAWLNCLHQVWSVRFLWMKNLTVANPYLVLPHKGLGFPCHVEG